MPLQKGIKVEKMRKDLQKKLFLHHDTRFFFIRIKVIDLFADPHLRYYRTITSITLLSSDFFV